MEDNAKEIVKIVKDIFSMVFSEEDTNEILKIIWR
jgi:hypothetical protein